jgi:hypothetical protein
VLRCPLASTANGQQHSSSCFVCNSQYHGPVQGGALAPAAGGLARARSLPLPPGHSAPPPPGSQALPVPAAALVLCKFCLESTKEMRIASVHFVRALFRLLRHLRKYSNPKPSRKNGPLLVLVFPALGIPCCCCQRCPTTSTGYSTNPTELHHARIYLPLPQLCFFEIQQHQQ